MSTQDQQKNEDPTGAIPVLISNKSGELLELSRNIIKDEVLGILGKTWKDMLQHMGGLGNYSGSQPDWSVDVTGAMMPPDRFYKKQKELSAGTYISVCWTNVPHKIYLADGGLIVED